MTLTTTLDTLAIALVFGNVRLYTSIPQELASVFGVKSAVTIEKRICIIKPELIKLPKDAFQAVD